MDDLLIYVALAMAGLFAGAVNAIAGGATFFTFPVLVWAGLSPFVANATNMIALTPSNIAALPAYRDQLSKMRQHLVWPSIAGFLGGIMGAFLVLGLGSQIFAGAVPYLMAAATLIFAVAPTIRRWISRGQQSGVLQLGAGSFAVVLIFSAYGGYFGAGLGQILLAAAILIGVTDLHQANALKNLIVSVVSLTAMVIFGLSGAVHWPFALTMAVSASIGGYLGGRYSQVLPQAVMRWVVIAFGAIVTLAYFWPT